MTAGPRNRGARARERAVAALFGDHLGLVVFLAAVVFLGLCWRVGFFITDTRTVANLLANVADGRLAVVDAPYSLTATGQPGLVEVDGRLYGRNYGQVYLAVPAVWLLDAASALLDLRMVLAGLWSLAVVALGRSAAGVLERPVLADLGAAAGLGSIGLAALTRTALPAVDLYIVALQLTTLLVAAAGATVLYRLLALVDDRRVGLAGGLGLVLATPIGFWGTLPKRHVYTATALLLVCFWFALARTAEGRQATLARAGTYGAIGLLAAVHAFEAAFMAAVLVPFDLATARAAPRRGHAVVVVAFLLALAPMLATNLAIAGDPLQPPRQLPDASAGGLPADLGDDAPPPPDPGGTDGGGGDAGTGGGDGGTDGDAGTGGGGEDGGGADGGPPPVLVPVVDFLATVGWIGGYMWATLLSGVATLGEPGRLVHTFVRSGWIPGVNYAVNDYEAVELALLEVLPLAGALASVPVLFADRLTAASPAGGRDLVARAFRGIRPVDLLAATMGVVFLLVYLPLLPLQSMITVRYVLPAMPLLLYAVCRLAPVRAAVRQRGRLLARGYAVTLAAGAVVLVVGMASLDPAVGEALQLHALIGLAAATVVALAVASWPAHRSPGAVAAGLAVAAGVTTLFLAAAALWHLQYGPYALDVAALVAEALPGIG